MKISKKLLDQNGWDMFVENMVIDLKDEHSDVALVFKDWVKRQYPEWDGESKLVVVK